MGVVDGIKEFGANLREQALEAGNDVAEWFDNLVTTAQERENDAELKAVRNRVYDLEDRLCTLEETLVRVRSQRRWAWTVATIFAAALVGLLLSGT